MEGAPFIPESSQEKSSESDSEKSTDKKKKKRGEAILHLVEDKEKSRRERDEPKKEEAKVEAEDKSEKVEKLLTEDKSFQQAVAEVEPASEKEAPTEEVGEQEKALIEPELVKLNRENDAEPRDEAVERFRDLIVVEGKDSEAAYEEVMTEDLGVDKEEIPEIADAESVEAEIAEEEPAATDEEIVFDRQAESAVDEAPESEDDAAATPPASPVTPHTTPGPASGGATGGPGGGMPPRTPTPPFGPGPGAPYGPYGPGGFNTAPPVPLTSPNNQPRVEQLDDGASPAAMALFGGIIGYLIGRRRGRIKTEKKLLPIQKKLEKQVTNLQWQLQEKEAAIRRAAARQVKEKGPAIIDAIAAKNATTKSAERPSSSIEALIERRKAPEAHLLHGSPAPEKIGHVLVAAEAPRMTEKSAEKPKEVKVEEISARRVETLNRTELLELSEKITVEGSTLRQIYETHLVGERGLRRLIAEHLRGGDLKKALRQEITEREIDFERDPAIRDMAPVGSGATGGGTATGGKAVLDKLVEQAARSLPASEEMAYYKARADYDAKQLRREQERRRLMDIGLTTVIVALIAAVVFLFLTRG